MVVLTSCEGIMASLARRCVDILLKAPTRELMIQLLGLGIGFVAGMDFLMFGYDQGVMGGLLTLESFLKTFPEINVQDAPPDQSLHTSIIQGITIGAYTLACMFGAITTIFVGDNLGRRKTILVGTIIMVIGAVIQTASFGLGQLIAGRIITGWGNGMNTSTIPIWQSESSASHARGRMVMIEGALITGGIMLSYWIDFGFSFLEPSSVAWRFPIGFQIFFAVFILAFIMGMPESPRWLVLKNRNEEAIDVLCALNAKQPDDPTIQAEFKAIQDTVAEASQAGYKDLFSMGKERRFQRVALGFMAQVFQQITGINLITYYAANILETIVGLSPFLSRIIAACNGTEYFLASWIAVFLIEKVGRRKLMIFGATGQALSMMVLAITVWAANPASGVVATVFLFMFNSFFAIGRCS